MKLFSTFKNIRHFSYHYKTLVAWATQVILDLIRLRSKLILSRLIWIRSYSFNTVFNGSDLWAQFVLLHWNGSILFVHGLTFVAKSSGPIYGFSIALNCIELLTALHEAETRHRVTRHCCRVWATSIRNNNAMSMSQYRISRAPTLVCNCNVIYQTITSSTWFHTSEFPVFCIMTTREIVT